METPEKDRFFVTLGRLMRLAGREFESLKSEHGEEEWDFMTTNQKFNILDKHVLEITADVIHDLQRYMQLKLSPGEGQAAAKTEEAKRSTSASGKSKKDAYMATAAKKCAHGCQAVSPTPKSYPNETRKATPEVSPKTPSYKSAAESAPKKVTNESLSKGTKPALDESTPPTDDLAILEAIVGTEEVKEPPVKTEQIVEDAGLDPDFIEQIFAAAAAASQDDAITAIDETCAVDKFNEDDGLEDVFKATVDKTPYYPIQPYFGRAFVIDNGSETIRAGFGDEPYPRAAIVNAVQMPLLSTVSGEAMKDAGEGNDKTRNRYRLHYAMENGVIKDWQNMEDIWGHIFKSLFVNPSEHPILMSDLAINTVENRKRITEIMFEEFHVPGFCIQSQSVLSMYGAGTPTGVAVDIGEGIATVMPVYEYNALPYALQSSEIAGSYLNKQLRKAMKRHYLDDRHITQQPQMAREIKEKYCYVACDFDEETTESTNSPGIRKAVCNLAQEVYLSDEVFTVPEALFKPKVLGEEDLPGIHDLIMRCIKDTDVQVRSALSDNVIVSGGTTLLPGFVERLRKELMKIDPSLNVIAPIDRKDLVWRGGACMSTLPSFQNGLITAQDYMEFGSEIVRKKC